MHQKNCDILFDLIFPSVLLLLKGSKDMTILQSVLQLKVGNFVHFSALCIIHSVAWQSYNGECHEDLLKGRLTDPCRWDYLEVCKLGNN